MKEKLEQILKDAQGEIEKCDDVKMLDEVRVKFLGKQGELTSILRNMKEVPPEERKTVGMLANGVREKVEEAIAKKGEKLNETALKLAMEKEKIDITMPSKGEKRGALHPLTRFNNKFMDICVAMGFTVIQGPEIDTDYYNFEALNVPKIIQLAICKILYILQTTSFFARRLQTCKCMRWKN